jgi:uncharacterized protein YndB with AHSA1/START domain
MARRGVNRTNGGRLHFANNGSAIAGAVLVWDPARVVEFEWSGGPTQAGGSRVRFAVTPDGEGSRLVLTHSRVHAPVAADFAAGWHHHLDTLDAVTRAGKRSSAPTWKELHLRYSAVSPPSAQNEVPQ